MTPTFKIEKNVKISPRGGTLYGQLLSTMHSLKIGDSFVYNVNNQYPFAVAKRAGIKITTRKIGDGSGWRIWRIK